MTWPPTISTEFAPPNWDSGPLIWPPVGILIHNTVGRDSRKYLQRGGDRADGSDHQVSIQRLIQRDGVIYKYLDDRIGANHAGYGTMPAPWGALNPNDCTLSIELENISGYYDKTTGKTLTEAYTDDQMLACGWQINEWRRLYGPLVILTHRQVDPTRRSDPIGLTIGQIEEWCQRAAAKSAPSWDAWGLEYPLPVEQRGWGIPRAWMAAGGLGRALSHPIYHRGGTGHAVQWFEHGSIFWDGKRATVVRG